MRRIVLSAFIVAVGLVANSTAVRAQSISNAFVDPNRIVLIINGEEIKGGEYYRRMEFLPGVGARAGNSFTEFPPGFLTIQKLIDERITLALAKDKGVYPSDAEVDAEIKIRQIDNPKMLEDWMSSGGNIDELRYQIRVQVATFNIETFGITKTDVEVEDFYQKHPDLYTIPKQLKLRIIAVSSPDETKVVDQDLAAGKDFASVAKERSMDAVTKSIGGEFGTIPEYKLSTASKEALTSVKIGQTTKWLTTSPDGGQGTYLKYFLEDIIPSKKLDLDAALKRQIRRKLMLDAGHIKNNSIPKELDLLRAKAKIDIKSSEFADAYQRYLKAYLQQRGISQ